MDTKAFIKTFMNKMQTIQEKILDYLDEEESQESQLYEFLNEQMVKKGCQQYKNSFDIQNIPKYLSNELSFPQNFWNSQIFPRRHY